MDKAKTPTRTVRVSDELWFAAKDKAAVEGCTVTDVIVASLEAFVESSSGDLRDSDLFD